MTRFLKINEHEDGQYNSDAIVTNKWAESPTSAIPVSKNIPRTSNRLRGQTKKATTNINTIPYYYCMHFLILHQMGTVTKYQSHYEPFISTLKYIPGPRI